LGLDLEEQQALVKFMEALTDDSFEAYVPERLPEFNKGSKLQEVSREVD